jgi:hypothetical protein
LAFLINIFIANFILPVLAFAQNEKKGAFGILLDNTGTLRPQFGNVQILGYAVAQNVSQRGFVSLFNFETSGNSKKPFAVIASGSEWSQDKNAFENILSA